MMYPSDTMDKYAILERISEYEEMLYMYDFTDPKRYEIERKLQNLEDWLEDLKVVE